jgi:hypothetical protein
MGRVFCARRVWHVRRILVAAMSVVPDPQAQDAMLSYHSAVSDFKRRLIEATLHRALGNRTHAARALGLQRTYLLRLIRELRVAAPPPQSRGGRSRAEAVAREHPGAAAPSHACPDSRVGHPPASPPPAGPPDVRRPSAPAPAPPALYPPSRPPARAPGHHGRRLSR